MEIPFLVAHGGWAWGVALVLATAAVPVLFIRARARRARRGFRELRDSWGAPISAPDRLQPEAEVVLEGRLEAEDIPSLERKKPAAASTWVFPAIGAKQPDAASPAAILCGERLRLFLGEAAVDLVGDVEVVCGSREDYGKVGMPPPDARWRRLPKHGELGRVGRGVYRAIAAGDRVCARGVLRARASTADAGYRDSATAWALEGVAADRLVPSQGEGEPGAVEAPAEAGSGAAIALCAGEPSRAYLPRARALLACAMVGAALFSTVSYAIGKSAAGRMDRELGSAPRSVGPVAIAAATPFTRKDALEALESYRARSTDEGVRAAAAAASLRGECARGMSYLRTHDEPRLALVHSEGCAGDDVRRERASAHLELGDVGAASEELAAMEAPPRRSPLGVEVARVHMLAGNWERALAVIEDCATGMRYLREHGKPQLALARGEDCLGDRAAEERALSLALLGMFDEASAELKKAEKRNPEEIRTRVRIHILAKQWERAARALAAAKATRELPSPEGECLLAALKARAGDEEARAWLRAEGEPHTSGYCTVLWADLAKGPERAAVVSSESIFFPAVRELYRGPDIAEAIYHLMRAETMADAKGLRRLNPIRHQVPPALPNYGLRKDYRPPLALYPHPFEILAGRDDVASAWGHLGRGRLALGWALFASSIGLDDENDIDRALTLAATDAAAARELILGELAGDDQYRHGSLQRFEKALETAPALIAWHRGDLESARESLAALLGSDDDLDDHVWAARFLLLREEAATASADSARATEFLLERDVSDFLGDRQRDETRGPIAAALDGDGRPLARLVRDRDLRTIRVGFRGYRESVPRFLPAIAAQIEMGREELARALSWRCSRGRTDLHAGFALERDVALARVLSALGDADAARELEERTARVREALLSREIAVPLAVSEELLR